MKGGETREGKQGQIERSFTIKSDCDYFKNLWQQTKFGSLTVSIESEKNLCEQMRKYSERLFPNLKSYISAYTFRHNFASLAKSQLTNLGVAVCLGHSNTTSQRLYSNKKTGSTSFVIDNINGTTKPKDTSPRKTYVVADAFSRLSM